MITRIRKRITLIILAACCCWLPVLQCHAQNFIGKKEKIVIAEPEKSLRIGEKLEYSLEWLGVAVGKIVLHVEGEKNINGHDCYYVTASAMPNKYLSKIYDVEYIVHTYIDKKDFHARRFEKTRRVKDKYSHVVIDFDRENRRVRYKSEGSAPLFNIGDAKPDAGESLPQTLEIINGTQDLFSSIYYLRLLDIKENHSYDIRIYYGKKNWPLSLKAGKPFMKDIRHQGTFAVFEAVMSSDLGEFILGKSDMVVYFSADSRRIPVEFKFGSGLGFIRGVIQDISG